MILHQIRSRTVGTDELRAAVAEHGSLLVRGLRLRDAAETEAVFRRLGSLMTEKEGFTPRRRYSQGVYSASKWPPNQHMCMHHELSYVLEFPCLMMFACLVAATDGGRPRCRTRRLYFTRCPRSWGAF